MLDAISAVCDRPRVRSDATAAIFGRRGLAPQMGPALGADPGSRVVGLVPMKRTLLWALGALFLFALSGGKSRTRQRPA